MKTTVAAIETAALAAETAIAAYADAKRALYVRRNAGEVTAAAAEKERLLLSIPVVRAVKALVALCGHDLDETPSEALMARCDKIDAWRE